ncbi:DUF2922 domain-containing protein [Vagococcus coleopterorum]|uniref:DUF2922 domain-containing protein n=1 Tax=Vagococcus coleopterorum TaxID=2714946 RepID=A0A6G8AL04_9ENTE|nr:DUF2922 domain-containing protein [Vagococcus coleopterorum]QIL45642.1 DUF2922 domain-containing protein [Vagococcus coleopterorum]
MIKKLHLEFLDANGVISTLSPTIAREDLTAKEITTFMSALIELKLFKHKGYDKYTEIHGAYYTETSTIELM